MQIPQTPIPNPAFQLQSFSNEAIIAHVKETLEFEIFTHLTPEQKLDKTLFSALIDIHHLSFAYADDKLKYDADLVKQALNKDGSMIGGGIIPQEFRKQAEFAWIAIKNQPWVYSQLSDKFYRNKEFALFAINHGITLNMIYPPLLKDLDIVQAALNNTPDNFQFLPSKFKNDPHLVLKVLQKNPDMLAFAGKKLHKLLQNETNPAAALAAILDKEALSKISTVVTHIVHKKENNIAKNNITTLSSRKKLKVRL